MMAMIFNRKYIITAVAVCLALALFACGKSTAEQWQEQYDLGQKYLTELDYEQALLAFTSAIEIDASRVETYLLRADTYFTVARLSTDQQEKAEYSQKARKDYEYIISTSGLTPDIFYNLADIFIEEKDETALEDLVLQAEEIIDRDMLNSWLYDRGYYLNDSNELEARLTQIGATDDMISIEDITLYGYAPRNLDIWTGSRILKEQGYSGHQLDEYDIYVYGSKENDEVGVGLSPSDDGSSVERITFAFSNWGTEGYHDVTDTMILPIGIRDINLGDTMEEVLTKIGFSNGKDISERLKSIMAENMYPKGDEFQYAEAPLDYVYNDDTVWVDFGVSLNGETGKIVGLDIDINFYVSRTLYYSFRCCFKGQKYDEQYFEDKLRQVEIEVR